MKKISKKDKEKIKELVEANIYLVENIVRKISASLPSHVDRDDLISCGLLGLVQAASRFEPSKGVKFELWAELRIRGAILDHLRSLDFMTRPTRTEIKKISSATTELKSQLGRDPDDSEIAKAIGMNTEEFREFMERVSYRAIVSLDDIIADVSSSDGKRRLYELIPDPSTKDPFEVVTSSMISEMVSEAIDKLPDREKDVLRLYYLEGVPMKQIAKDMAVTESRVSQIHARALLMLRESLNGKI